MAELPQIGPSEPVAAAELSKSVSNDDQSFTSKPFAPLVGFMDIGESELTNQAQTMLNEVWEYLAEQTKSELTSERLYALQQLENRLSPPRLGQSRLHKLHGYVKAQREVERMEKMRNSFLKGVD